jgi:hypothetical protein
MVLSLTHLVISWGCIPTHTHNEGASDGISGFIGIEVGFDNNLIGETEGFFEKGVVANVGRGDRMKGGSSKYLTG